MYLKRCVRRALCSAFNSQSSKEDFVPPLPVSLSPPLSSSFYSSLPSFPPPPTPSPSLGPFIGVLKRGMAEFIMIYFAYLNGKKTRHADGKDIRYLDVSMS